MDNKILYAIMTLLFSCYGVPHFMQGKIKTGIVRVVIAVIPVVNLISLYSFVMGIIQGIKIFQMTDEEYAAADKASLLVGWPTIEE